MHRITNLSRTFYVIFAYRLNCVSCTGVIEINDRACRLLFTEKGARLVDGAAGPDRLICAQQIWIRLLIGELNAPTAFAANLLEASTPHARRLAEILFPELPVWRTAWDNFINI